MTAALLKSVFVRGLEDLYVDGLRSLVAGLGVIGDLGALGERLVAVADDARVVHEEILARLVRGDEAEALLVAEPLHGSGCHVYFLRCVSVLRNAEDAGKQPTNDRLHGLPTLRVGSASTNTTVAVAAASGR